MWGLVSLKFIKKAGRWETQAGGNVEVLSLKFVEQSGKLESKERFFKQCIIYG